MSTPFPGEKYCEFEPPYSNTARYICYENETCCPTGCCPSAKYQYLHRWYFWGIAIFLIIIFYVLSEYCKRIEKRRIRRMQSRLARNYRRERTHYRNEVYNVDNLFERLIQNYRTHFEVRPHVPVEPPPRYSDAVLMPKPKKKTKNSHHIVAIHPDGQSRQSNGNPREDNTDAPTYEEAMSQNNDNGDV